MSNHNPDAKTQTNSKLNMVILSLVVIFLCGYGSIFSFPQQRSDYINGDLRIYFNILKYLKIIGFLMPFIFTALVLLAFKKHKESKSDDEFFGILLTAVGVINIYISAVVSLFGRMYPYTSSDDMFSGLNHLAKSYTAILPFLILGLFLASKSKRKNLWWRIGLLFIIMSPILPIITDP